MVSKKNNIDDDNASETSQESEIPASHKPESGGCCGRKRLLAGCFLLLILVGIAIALGVTLSRENDAVDEANGNLRGSNGGSSSNVEHSDNGQGGSQVGQSGGSNQGGKEIPEQPLVQPNKMSWPELTGKPIENAKRTIEQQRPDLTVIVVPVGALVQFDYNKERVWLWEDEEGLVAELPRVG